MQRKTNRNRCQFQLKNLVSSNRFTLGNHFLKNILNLNYLGSLLDFNMSLVSLFAKIIKIVSCKLYSLVKIGNFIDVKCASTIYKQTILPLLDYSGFMLIFGKISDPNNL